MLGLWFEVPIGVSGVDRDFVSEGYHLEGVANKMQVKTFTLVALALAFAVVLIMAIVYVTWVMPNDDKEVSWSTYENEPFHYQISYPPNWSIQVHNPPPGERPNLQSVVLNGEHARVIAAVSFQGGWCESAARQTTTQVTVSGKSGTEYVCFYAGQDVPYSIVRTFPNAVGENNYVVWSEFSANADSVRRVVESFQFLQ